jgi:hypothetical glycosyl hydrolase
MCPASEQMMHLIKVQEFFMKYDAGTGEFKNWIVRESRFYPEAPGKCETIFCQGNGYMGIRAATEESYLNTTRGAFIAGSFNRFGDEVSEIPNANDVIGMDININGCDLLLNEDNHSGYSRSLNLKNGLLTRTFTYNSGHGGVAFEFNRLVSLDDKHLIAQDISITPIDTDIQLKIISGINGRITNRGTQHFLEGDKRCFDNQFLQYESKTIRSDIDFVTNTAHSFLLNGKEYQPVCNAGMDRRRVFADYTIDLKKGDRLIITKISNIYTTRDKDFENKGLSALKDFSLLSLRRAVGLGFNELHSNSAAVWERIWEAKDIDIRSVNDFDQLSLRYALYHLTVMTPVHDERMNVGAKGLSGEGYQGHTYWDTEIFIMPPFVHTDPEAAKTLMKQRYLMLHSARRKAEGIGYKGAMFPWATAWLDDGESFPLYSGIDIMTHQRRKMWVGIIELHVVADIAFGAYYYYMCTRDQEFMDAYGYELIFDTAIFWNSRFEYNQKLDRYEINDVIGPDEYKIHVNNNAFTNYMAHWNVKKAIEYYEEIKSNKELHDRLNENLNLDNYICEMRDKLDKIYLPRPNKDHLLPQDDTFLDLDKIDLSEYKGSMINRLIYRHYNFEALRKIQVSKQADVALLLFLMGNLCDEKTKRASFFYYEDKCLHDSSLSVSTYSIMAADLTEKRTAYELYQRACEIDLGPQMDSCNAGVHAASYGGIWQCVVNGFCGIRMVDGELWINPNLPDEWERVSLPFIWQGETLRIDIGDGKLIVVNESMRKEITFMNGGEKHTVKTNIVLPVSR